MSQKNPQKARFRTSTLVLMFTMLSMIACLCSFVLSINHNYKSGNYWYSNSDKSQFRKIGLSLFPKVIIESMDNCLVVSSDSLSLEIFNDDVADVQITTFGDSVRITPLRKPSGKLLIYAPTNTQLIVRNSTITMNGSLDFANPPSYVIDLENSRLTASSRDYHAFVQQLKIFGKGEAFVEIPRRFHIHELQLSNTTFAGIAEAWTIGSIKTAFNNGMASEMQKMADSVSIVGRREPSQ